MTQNRPTIEIIIQVSDAESALESLIEAESREEKERAIDTIRLALKIFEHKFLRIKELEMQIDSIRNDLGNVREIEYIQEIAEQDRIIKKYENMIVEMRQDSRLSETGS